jgi:hypothetical protein
MNTNEDRDNERKLREERLIASMEEQVPIREGLPDFFGITYQNGEKYTKWPYMYYTR